MLSETYSFIIQIVNDIIRVWNVEIYVYGAIVSVAPYEILKDFSGLKGAIVGDPEDIIYDMYNGILRDKSMNNELNIIYGGLFNIEKNRYSSESLITYGKIREHIRINTSNGCLHDCSFCILNKRHGISNEMILCVRNMKDVFKEIIYIYEKYNITSFFFNDRNIVDGGKERLWELCSYLEEYGESFSFCAFARADSFTYEDLDLLKCLRKNGFVMFDIGIEAGNDADLALYNKQNTIVFDLFSKTDIDIRTNFIMINPFSTWDRLAENYMFLKENEIHTWQCFVSKLKLFCGTALFRKACDEGRIIDRQSPKAVFDYQCKDPFADDYKKFAEWLIREKKDWVEKSFINEKTLERIREIMVKENIIYEKYANRVENIKRELAHESSDYFSFILDKNVDKAYLTFDNFRVNLERQYFKIAVLWKQVNRVLNNHA